MQGRHSHYEQGDRTQDSWDRGRKLQPMPQQHHHDDIAPLKVSENAWKKQEAKDDIDKARKSSIALLNKLTKDNFDRICIKFLDGKTIDMSSGVDVMKTVIDQIFEKALTQ